MTRQKWEYASVVYTEAIRKVFKTDPEYERLSPEVKAEWEQKEWKHYWWYTHTFQIWLPGASEADERVGRETTEDGWQTSGFKIANELGADGWEMVSTIVENHAMGATLGRDTTSYPTKVVTRFKRPVG